MESVELGSNSAATFGRNKSGMEWKKGSDQMVSKRKTIRKDWGKHMDEKRKIQKLR